MALIVQLATVVDIFIGTKMAIDTSGRQQVDYFVGTEVENTAMKNQKTLFVVGIKPVEEIIALADREGIKHLYFGTSQSFHPHSPYDWAQWDDMIRPLLIKDYWVTLDFGIEYATTDFHDCGWCEYFTFIPMISAKLPYVNQFNYNATLKIDDKTWGDSNPGVWCHPLNELLTRNVYTDWKDYVGDTTVYPETTDHLNLD
jgi:hypothetical protein